MAPRVSVVCIVAHFTFKGQFQPSWPLGAPWGCSRLSEGSGGGGKPRLRPPHTRRWQRGQRDLEALTGSVSLCHRPSSSSLELRTRGSWLTTGFWWGVFFLIFFPQSRTGVARRRWVGLGFAAGAVTHLSLG